MYDTYIYFMVSLLIYVCLCFLCLDVCVYILCTDNRSPIYCLTYCLASVMVEAHLSCTLKSKVGESGKRKVIQREREKKKKTRGGQF